MKPTNFARIFQTVGRAWLLAGLAGCSGDAPAQAIDLSGIRLPPGFVISVYSDQVPGARQMTLGDDGTVYVGTIGAGKVYALNDADGDGRAEPAVTVATGLNAPNGVAWLGGDLYIAEVSRIGKISDIRAHRQQPVSPNWLFDGYPGDKHHGWKYLRAGPDGKLYTAVGAPCNVCKPEKEIYATLTRLDPDGKNFEIVARGLRNSVGFDWHPESHELWLTDNGRDWLGNDRPPDELNRLTRPGQHFGFPHCFGADISDPEFGKEAPCSAFTPPAWSFPAHVAALGLRFYTGTQFPAEYRQQLFIAQHGSWNRTPPQGYRVALVRFEGGRPVAETAFAEGWLRPDGSVTGRPVDVLQMPDGALLVSDDHAGAIYRITYQPSAQPIPNTKP
jgi:glucose/arabinose dehydrogenase